MSVCKNILIAFLCGATICAPALANNCDNELYRRYNPDKCISDTKNNGFSLATTATVASGAAALIGGTIALLGLSSGGDNSDASTSAPAATQVHTTLPTYNHVGGDIDHIHLSSVMGNTEYIRNQNQYNEIRLAYSLARGFTGAGSTIAVLDSGRNTYHGGNVAYLARGQVAPNANVVSYQVSDQYDNFKSFGEISDVINSATTNGTNIYNASWSADIFANQIRNRAQIERLTGTNFINSLTNAANQNDAIFVWAAGNDANSQSSFLSAMPLFVPELNGHFVNVVAWDSATGGLADFSNECGITKNFCITAPGTGLDSPMASAAQQPLDGTSFAAPIVSAAIAVIREAFPYMQSTEITALLFATARDLGDVGIDTVYGHGMLDLERATRPVGATLVPLSDDMTIALNTARVSSTIAHQIKSKNIRFAFVDSFGRAFDTNLNDNIRVQNRGIGFERLRQDNTNRMQFGNIEMGFKSSDMFASNGFLQTDSKHIINFIGVHDSTTIGNTELFYGATMGFSNPDAAPDSMITGFSTIYTTTASIGAKYNDFTFKIATPDTIIGGNMYLRTPTGRRIDGQYTFAEHTVNLATRPSVEYSVSYKNMTAAFVDNPYGTDEFYIMTKTKLYF